MMIASHHDLNLKHRIHRLPPGQRHALRAELRWFLTSARAPRLRTMRQFAEDEIVIPDGPFEGRKFSCARQPYTRLWFDAVDSGRWNRFAATGPTQSGKTLSAFVVPVLYHLFEIGETVICGLPQLDMATDKWREDLLPAIERSRFRDLLPTRGSGSKGAAKLTAIQFRNGATLRFMGGGGGDKQRSAFTSRILVVTEVDGLDEAGEASREADKVTQLEARTRAYGSRKRVYLECTVSTEEGRIWTEYQNGTRSRIALLCPHCRTFVSPEREHFHGWQNADSQVDAADLARFFCPNCAHDWTEDDRRLANTSAVLVHRDQEISADGDCTGYLPRTNTLGFRWSAVNNLFLTARDIGSDEWRASRAVDEELAEREMRQFVWALPAKPQLIDTTALDAHEITRRTHDRLPPRGLVPANRADRLTLAIDLGKWVAHYMLIGWNREHGAGHVVDYGIFEVPSDRLDLEHALLAALRQFADEIIEPGWPIEGDTEGLRRLVPDQVWIDSSWQPEPVYTFARERARGLPLKHHRYRAAKGFGRSQERNAGYHGPKEPNKKHCAWVGDQYHIARLPAARIFLVEVNADHWKTYAHRRLGAPLDGGEAPLTLFRAQPHEHLALARHLTAERETEEFEPGKGITIRWERIRHDNHWLDCLYNACAAAHFAGIRLMNQPGLTAAGGSDLDSPANTTGAGARRPSPASPSLHATIDPDFDREPGQSTAGFAFNLTRDDF